VQEEGWVVCRVFKKRVTTTMRKMNEHDSPCWYDDQVSFMQDMDSPNQTSQSNLIYQQLPYPCKKELDNLPYQNLPREHFLNLPLLESPKLLQPSSNITSNQMVTTYGTIDHANSMLPSSSMLLQEEHILNPNQQNFHAIYGNNNSNIEQGVVDEQVTDWRVLDKFVASQLSQDASKDNNTSNIFHGNAQLRNLEKQEMVPHENASTSNSSCPIDLWK
jgi:hypothetical protein